jgi:tRNA threonylcarbamoyl adenosine modification protein (Sua5/YciO/YrdC/YwlC family)
LFKLKKRSRNHELPVIVSDVDQAMSLAIGVPPAAERLMEKFWPGALTLVLPRNPDFVADLGGDEDTIAIRCPDHIVPRLLCEEVGPLAVTTANTEGAQPAMTAQEVSERFGEVIAIVLDAGRCDRNLATVVDVTGIVPKLLREGQVAWVDIQDVLD